jgi:hypothetical protein
MSSDLLKASDRTHVASPGRPDRRVNWSEDQGLIDIPMILGNIDRLPVLAV